MVVEALSEEAYMRATRTRNSTAAVAVAAIVKASSEKAPTVGAKEIRPEMLTKGESQSAKVEEVDTSPRRSPPHARSSNSSTVVTP